MVKLRDWHLTSNVSKKRTICEVHREIYDIVQNLSDFNKREQVIDLLEEAFLMAKKMNDKLFEYKKDWDKGFFAPETQDNISRKKKLRGNR